MRVGAAEGILDRRRADCDLQLADTRENAPAFQDLIFPPLFARREGHACSECIVMQSGRNGLKTPLTT